MVILFCYNLKMDYYKKKIFLAQVDKNDKIIGKIDRWQTHQNSLLHRGFTVVLIYQNKFVLQHRKHLVFDKYFDLTFSSHQIYVRDILQTDEEAINQTLKREWNIDLTAIKGKPTYLGKFYYLAKDPKTIFTEHEIDHIYIAQLKTPPRPNLDFAYGFQLVNKEEISNYKLAPWAKKILNFIK